MGWKNRASFGPIKQESEKEIVKIQNSLMETIAQ